MNDPIENPNDAWERCPPGELQRLVRGVRLHHHVRAIRRTVLAGGAATLVAVTAWMTVSHFWLLPDSCERGHCIAGVYCEDVRREMPDLIAMRLEPQRGAQLHGHIDQCPDCRRLMEKMERDLPLSFDRHEHRHGECPHCDHAAELVAARSWIAPTWLATSVTGAFWRASV